MNIIEALQDKNNTLRISGDYRWLCGDGIGGWIVFERKPYAKKTSIVLKTDDEELAVEALLESV